MFSLRCYNLNAIHSSGLAAAVSRRLAQDVRNHQLQSRRGQMNDVQFSVGCIANDSGLGYVFPEKLRL